MKKLSYRDTGARMVADSLYCNSTPIHRSMSEVAAKFTGYNDINSPSHDQAVAYV